MKQIILYVYQSIDGCPARPDKQVDDAIEQADCLLTDGETYLTIFLNHLGWPLTNKDTFVVTKAACDLTEKERVQFITGDAAAELGYLKTTGNGVMVAYGEEIASVLLDNGLADEIVVITVPDVAGGNEKALQAKHANGAPWVVRSCRVLEDERVRTVYGRG